MYAHFRLSRMVYRSVDRGRAPEVAPDDRFQYADASLDDVDSGGQLPQGPRVERLRNLRADLQ